MTDSDRGDPGGGRARGDGFDHGDAPDHWDHDDLDERIERLEDPRQFRYLSAEELRSLLGPRPDWVVADLGSGTGFFTDELASVVGTLYAIDIRDEMHRVYRANGLPANVETVTADVAAVPLPDDGLDAAVSVRTFHHGVSGALDEVARLLRPGGRLVVVDWSATGAGERERGQDPDHYYDLASVQAALLEAGFRIRDAGERRETFVVVASLRSN
ncbi:MAG: class I SAM-dependent methyltransferase [Halobacteriales archaeon]